MIIHSVYEFLDLKGWLIFICIFLLLAEIFKNKNPPNFPPGPQPLPFLGNVFTGVDFKSMDKLSEKYGKVFSLRRGTDKVVVVSGHEMVKQALVTQLDSFMDRPLIPLFDEINHGLGVVLSNGYLWKMQRKLAITHLKHFGEGKKDLEQDIQLESSFLCDAIKEEQGRPFDPQLTLTNAVSNIISSLVFGHRFEYTDQHFQNILRLDTDAILLAGTKRAQLYDVLPALFKHLPGPHQTMFSYYSQITGFLRDEIQKHMENWDPEDPHDYIDSYLGEIEKRKEDPEAGFNIETLVICTLDLFEAGTEPTSNTLRWGLLYMLRFPEVQEKVQKEIDTVIGRSRQPSLSDRASMPYTDAVIHEIQRTANILPLGFPKMASKDTTLGGYSIPKGTMITINLSSVLKDKSEWETPDEFNPGHFLDPQGKFQKRNAFVPFSVGKRGCLGEHLARMELFLFFTSLLQRFTFTSPPGVELSLEGRLGFTYSPKPYKLCALTR